MLTSILSLFGASSASITRSSKPDREASNARWFNGWYAPGASRPPIGGRRSYCPSWALMFSSKEQTHTCGNSCTPNDDRAFCGEAAQSGHPSSEAVEMAIRCRDHRRRRGLSDRGFTLTRSRRPDQASLQPTEAIVPASVESAQTAADPSSARSYSVGEHGSKFRLGFLEFEDDPDALAD
jgi:hypothetical protein